MLCSDSNFSSKWKMSKMMFWSHLMSFLLTFVKSVLCEIVNGAELFMI